MIRRIVVAGLLVAGGAVVYAGVTAWMPSFGGILAMAATGVPAKINHQGVVTVSGVRFTGTGQFRFAVINPATGLNLWTNDGTQIGSSNAPTAAVTLSVSDGIYNVALGDTGLANMTSIPASIFTTDDTAVRIWFDDGANGSQQLSPDHKLTSVPYAMTIAAGAVATDKIVDSAVTAGKLADDAVGTAKVQDGAITPAKLAADVAIVPVGSLIATARSTAPDGWLLCNGSAVSRTTYASLFAAIGTSYGTGDGSTTFNLPDLRGRVPMGAGQGLGDGASGSGAPTGTALTNRAMGNWGGKETHTLTTNEIPAHSHWITSFDGSNTSVLTFNDHSGDRILSSDNAANGSNGEVKSNRYATENAGGGQAHNNLQPYQVVHWIIKH